MAVCRRKFILVLPAGVGATLGTAAWAQAAKPAAEDDDIFALPMLQEADPRAVELGYVADAASVNQAKYPQHTQGQACANCLGFLGKPGDKAAGCDRIHISRRVSAKGWCSRYDRQPQPKA